MKDKTRQDRTGQDNCSSWFTYDDRDIEYHLNQFKKIYRSTEVFADFLDSYIKKSQSICDMACGSGANTAYLAEKYPNVKFTGIDFNADRTELGNKIIKEKTELKNVVLKEGNWYIPAKEDVGTFDGIISFQTLTWMPGYKKEIESLALLEPTWIAISSLFFEGEIDFDIKIKEYDRLDGDKPRETYYNIYSLPRIKEEFAKFGYTKFDYKKFDIDIDIPQIHKNHMGTYTEKLATGERLQISGALLMPWYFIVASR